MAEIPGQGYEPRDLMTIAEEKPKKYEQLRAKYLDPESLTVEQMQLFLEKGELRNVHKIEELGIPISLHNDAVFTGELTKHQDEILEGELFLPDMDKPLLVVYKPESGINQGTLEDTNKFSPPDESSSYSQKEEAAWILGVQLGFQYLFLPVSQRDYGDGHGSVRPFFWGMPVNQLPDDQADQFYEMNVQALEETAVIDYIFQMLDRRDTNILYRTEDGSQAVKLIDHSKAFFDESFALQFEVNGPRLLVAYDRTKPYYELARKPIPEAIKTRLVDFLSKEQDIQTKLSLVLNEREIDGVFLRTKKLVETGIFL